jgi:hypothetical protein
MPFLEILRTVGVPGSLLIVAAALLLFFNGRRGIAVAGAVATWIQALMIFGVILAVGYAGIVPGFSLTFDPVQVWSFVADLLP